MPNQVSLFVSHYNPGHVSPQMNRRSSLVPLQYTQVSTWVSQLNPCPISPPTGSQDFHLTSRQTPRLTSLHPDHVSAQYRSLHLRFTSISMMSHLHSDPQNCISAASKHISNPCGFNICALPRPRSPKLHPSSIQASYIYINIQVSRCSSHLHSGCISAQSRS